MKKELFAHPKHHFFLLVLIGLLALGQLQRVQVTSTWAINLFDVWLAAWLLFTGVTEPKLKTWLLHQRTKVPKVAWWLAGWIGLGWVLAAVASQLQLTSILYAIRLTLYLTSVGLWSFLLRQQLISQKVFTWSWSVLGGLILLFGFLQYFFLPDTRFLFFLGWDDHYHRLISTLLDPGFTGLILILSFFLLSGGRYWQKMSWWKWVLSAGFITGLALTYSRASYLAFWVGLGVVSLVSVQQRAAKMFQWAFIGILALAVLLPFLPQPGGEGVKLTRTASVTARTSQIQEVIQNLQPKDVVFGRGLFSPVSLPANASPYEVPDHANIADNWVLVWLQGTGVAGLGLFLILLALILRAAKHTNLWLLASWMAVLTHSLFNASLFYPWVVLFLGAMTILLSKRYG